jgi:hypothetical protein
LAEVEVRLPLPPQEVRRHKLKIETRRMKFFFITLLTALVCAALLRRTGKLAIHFGNANDRKPEIHMRGL